MADTLEELARRRTGMRDLADDARAAAIASAPNVVRFAARARQGQLRDINRKPPTGAPA